MTNTTTKELYTVAQTLNIAGRSKMNKAELIEAIEAHKAAMKDASNDYEKAQAFKDFQFLTRPESSAERAIVKRIDGKQRYFMLNEDSMYNPYTKDTSYYVEVKERVFNPNTSKFVYPFESIEGNQSELKALLLNEILDFISETKDDGQTYMTFDRELSLKELNSMPTLKALHFADVKEDTTFKQVSLSRITVEDGEEFDNRVQVFYNDLKSKFVLVQEYAAKGAK